MAIFVVIVISSSVDYSSYTCTAGTCAFVVLSACTASTFAFVVLCACTASTFAFVALSACTAHVFLHVVQRLHLHLY